MLCKGKHRSKVLKVFEITDSMGTKHGVVGEYVQRLEDGFNSVIVWRDGMEVAYFPRVISVTIEKEIDK
jgi:hypothetical protein